MNVQFGKLVSRTKAAIGALRVVFSVTILAGLLQVCHVQAADTDDFFTQSVVPEGRILVSFPLQFDGVGANEFALIVRSEQRGCRILIHREASSHNYNVTPAIDLELPHSVFAIQAADLDGDGRIELALLALESMYVIDFDEGGFAAQAKEVAKFERLFAVPNPDFVAEYEFLFDLNGDRNFDAVLPCWDGVRVHKRERTGFAAGRTIKITHGSIANLGKNLLVPTASCGLAITLPTIAAFDINSDRSKDIVVTSGSGLAVCYQMGDMQYPDVPSQLLEVRSVFLDNLKFMSWGLGDLNNDKTMDYCRVFTQGGPDEFKTVFEVYLAAGQGGYSQRPSKRIVLDQYCLGLTVADLDGDGAASAILATVGVSPTSLVKSLLVKRMQVDLNIFRSEGGILSDLPSSIKKIGCAVDIFSGGAPTRLIGCLHGDFDKDRINELVSLNDDDELEVFKGSRNPEFSDKPMLSREVQRCSWLDAIDLDLDGKSDLILRSVDETGRDVATLLWSK